MPPNKNMNEQKLLSLLYSGQAENIELAQELAKGLKVDLKTALKRRGLAKWGLDTPKKFVDLKKLNLQDQQIVQFPTEVCKIVCLEILQISMNKIAILPNEIGELIHLKELYLDNKMIKV